MTQKRNYEAVSSPLNLERWFKHYEDILEQAFLHSESYHRDWRPDFRDMYAFAKTEAQKVDYSKLNVKQRQKYATAVTVEIPALINKMMKQASHDALGGAIYKHMLELKKIVYTSITPLIFAVADPLNTHVSMELTTPNEAVQRLQTRIHKLLEGNNSIEDEHTLLSILDSYLPESIILHERLQGSSSETRKAAAAILKEQISLMSVQVDAVALNHEKKALSGMAQHLTFLKSKVSAKQKSLIS